MVGAELSGLSPPGSQLFVVSVLGSAVITGLLGAVAVRSPGRPGAWPFAGLMAAATVWAGAYGLGLLTPAPGPRLVLEQVQWIGIAFVPVCWLLFAFAYAGFDRFVDRPTVAVLSVVPLATVVLVFTAPAHDLFWTRTDVYTTNGLTLVQYGVGGWYLFNLVYAYGLFGIGTVVILWLAVSSRTLYTEQVGALAVGAVVPFVGNLLTNLGRVPLAGLDLTPFTFAVTGVLFGLALYRYELFGLLPTIHRIGRDAAIEELQEGVVIVDRAGGIVDVNAAAVALCHGDGDAVVGRPLGAEIDAFGADFPAGIPTDFRTDDGRVIAVSASAIRDGQDQVIGHAIVLRDVTDREEQLQQLRVLDRVLRHNMRNDMNVILGASNELEGHVADERSTYTAMIADRGTHMLELAEKGRQITAVLTAKPARQPVDLGAVLQRVTDACRERFPHADIDAAWAGGITVTATDMLGEAFEELVSNAVVHSDRETPAVTVRVRTDGDRATVRILDDGPGIPEMERAVVTGDREVDPLYHGSGLGLWLVSWIVRRSGGELTFEANRPRGSVATIELQLADAAA